MKVHSILVFQAVILSFVLVNCTKETNPEKTKDHTTDLPARSFASEKLDSLFLSELQNRKILLVSDANHGQGYFMFQVTGFLNAWLDHISPDSSTDRLPRKLVLFLECNKDVERSIDQFISIGDVYSFLKTNIAYDLEAHSNVFTIDYMIFLHELRNIDLRIRRLNEQGAKPEIDLQIIGAESDPPFYQKFFEMDQKSFSAERDAWFIKRDKICSENIHTFLNHHPGYKAMIFYGSVHLMRTRAGKSCMQFGLDPEIFDYYVSHYLDTLFGRNQVSVFWYASNPWIDKERVERPAYQEITPDYIIYSRPVPSAPMTFSFAKAHTCLKALHELLLTYIDSETPLEKQLAGTAAFKLTNAIARSAPDQSKEITRQFKVIVRNKDNASETVKFLQMINRFMNAYDVRKGIQNIPESLLYCACTDSMMYYRDVYLMLTNIAGMNVEWPRENLDDTAFRQRLLEKSNGIDAHMKEISLYIAMHQLFIASDEEKQTILTYLEERKLISGHEQNIWLNRLYHMMPSDYRVLQ